MSCVIIARGQGHPHAQTSEAVPRLVARTSYHTRCRLSVVPLRYRMLTSCTRRALRGHSDTPPGQKLKPGRDTIHRYQCMRQHRKKKKQLLPSETFLTKIARIIWQTSYARNKRLVITRACQPVCAESGRSGSPFQLPPPRPPAQTAWPCAARLSARPERATSAR